MTSNSQPAPFVSARLGGMMFLQFFVWGAWYVTTGNYMGTHGLGASIGHAYTVGPLAAILSPFLLGMIADRFFSSERVMAVLHILGGAAQLAAPTLAQVSADLAAQRPPLAEGESAPFLDPAHVPFLAALLVHMLCYMPTLGLSNTIAFHAMTSPERQFPAIRVFGTIGWIAANVVVSRVLKADFEATPFYVAGGSGVVLGVFSFFLPHTPPPAKGKSVTVRDVLGLDALSLMKERSFAILVICSMLLCVPLAGYYAQASVFVGHAGFRSPGFVMSLGQMSEIVFMLLMPLMLARLGIRWMLAVGMLAWVARYGLFAGAAPTGVAWMILGGIVLHGICYDFFFVAGQIFVDKRAPARVRAQAQGFLVLVTQGLGLGLGAQVFQALINSSKPSNATELATLGVRLRDQAGALEKASGGTPTAESQSLWDQGTDALLASLDWQTVWGASGILAAGVLIVFIMLFRDRKPAESAEAER